MRELQHESDKQCVMAALQQNGSSLQIEYADLEQATMTYAKHRQERVENFLEHVKAKHREYLEQACPASCMWS